MEVRDFLGAVVPWGHHVTVHWHNVRWKGHFRGRSCRTPDEVLQAAKQFALDYDFYFCLTSQDEGGGKREAANAVAARSLFIDVDIGSKKFYKTVEDAMEALLVFCKKTGMPKPSAVVLSGGGLHAYWFSDRDLPISEWKPYAEGLKIAAATYGFKIDPTVTADAARILRLPGTLNHKYGAPRVVELVEGSRGDKFDFSHTFKMLLGYAGAPKGSTARIEVADAFKHLDPNQKLVENAEVELPPLPFGPIKAGCGWLHAAHETGGREFDQPQWHLMALASTFMEDGREVFHALSNQHPGYAPGKTDDMFDRKVVDQQERDLGWPSCKTISDSGAGAHCKVCPHFLKGKSPLAIGQEAVREETIDKEMALLKGTRPPELRLPPGFCLNEKKQLCWFVPSQISKKKLEPAKLLLLIYNVIRNPQLQVHNGMRGISFVASADKGSEVEVFIGAGAAYRDSGLLTTLAENGVLYNPALEAKTMVERFATSWLDKLLEEDKASVRDPGMGWKHDDGKLSAFVYGGIMYNKDGTQTPLVQNTTDDEFRQWYMPKGEIEPWFDAAKLITDRKRPELNIILAVPFAAPLTVFAGALYGSVLSLYGGAGSGKSITQTVAASVWGHPKQTRESLTSTPKSVQGRLGRTKNLPAYWDDIQDERHQQALFDVMFVATEGTEGGRLNPDSSYKQRLEWQSMVLCCSNSSFVDYLMKKQKSTTAGIRRVFEIEYEKRDDPAVDPIEALRKFADLEHNYGRVGAKYAEMLARDMDGIKDLVKQVTSSFRETVKGGSDESYWWGLCGVLLTGALLARKIGIDLDIESMNAFLCDTFMANRKTRNKSGNEGGSFTNTRNAIVDFINEHIGAGHALYTREKFKHHEVPVTVLSAPNVGRNVFIQFVRDTRMILVSKRAFREWLEKKEQRPRQVLDGLQKHFSVKEIRHTLGAGTSFTLAQEMCLEIPVPIGPSVFEHLLVAHGKPVPELVPVGAGNVGGTS